MVLNSTFGHVKVAEKLCNFIYVGSITQIKKQETQLTFGHSVTYMIEKLAIRKFYE